MKSIATKFLLLLGIAMVAFSCDPKQPDEDVDTGVIGISQKTPSVGNESRVLGITFVSFGDWTVKSDSPWCSISASTLSGKTGDGVVKVNIEKNTDEDKARTAVITISVIGFADQVLCTVVQSKDGGAVGGLAANRWMSDYLMGHYLWNDSYGMIENKLDFDRDPEKFLQDALSRMTGHDDDGGYYADGSRYYYTTLAQMTKPGAASVSAKAPSTSTSLGIQFVYPVALENSYYLLIAAVNPGSAASALVKRGQYITSFNGSKIISENLAQVYAYAMGQAEIASAKFGISEFLLSEDGEKYVLTDIGEKEIVAEVYDKNPIQYYAMVQTKDLSKTIAYMVLSEFDASQDDKLIKLFAEFKSRNATDIIIDLRYNGGGDVYSSAVLGTLILGDAYKGKVYSHMEFNEMRKKTGEEEFFYIGAHPSMNEYQPIVDALGSSLGVKRAYVLASSFTASASELVINGLRGLGVDVYVVGGVTEGKNVGMEVAQSMNPIYNKYNFGNYMYQFAPITFYNKNAQGFKDYGEGFKPDYECDELVDQKGEASIVFDWKDGISGGDEMFYAAIKHITEGAWPVTKAKALSRSGNTSLRAVKDHAVMNSVRSRGTYVMEKSYYNDNQL